MSDKEPTPEQMMNHIYEVAAEVIAYEAQIAGMTPVQREERDLLHAEREIDGLSRMIRRRIDNILNQGRKKQ